MKKSKNLIPVRGVVLILLLMIAAIIGIAAGSEGREKKRRCSETVHAKIVRVEKDTDLEMRGGGKTYFTPCFAYTCNGTAYQVRGHVSSEKETAYQVGELVLLKVNPQQPEEFIDPFETHESGFMIFLAAAAAGLFVCYLIFSAVDSVRSAVHSADGDF